MDLDKDAVAETLKVAVRKGIHIKTAQLILDTYEKAKHGLVEQIYTVSYSLNTTNNVTAYSAGEAAKIFLAKHRPPGSVTINTIELYNTPPITAIPRANP